MSEAREKAIAGQNLDDNNVLLRFDRAANRVGLPAILVVKYVKSEGKTFGVVRTLMLDTDAVRLKPRVLNLNNTEKVELPTLPQHVFNDTYWNRIGEFLRTSKGISDLTILDAGPFVVSKDFNFKDEFAVTGLVIESVNRCDDIIGRVRGEVPFSVASVKRADEFFTSRIDLQTGNLGNHDRVGNPIRSDMVISMGRSSKTQQDASDFYDADTSFNSLSCFVNLEFTPPQTQGMQGMYGQPAPTQFLTPAVVITDVKQADWITANTLELYLLALSNAYRVTTNTQWARVFLPAVGKKNDPRDIGAIGYLMGQNNAPGQKIPTKGDSFSEADFVNLMQTAIKPLPSFMIDINPMGANAALEAFFLEAAGNGPNKTAAVNAILRGVNALTGNQFGQQTAIFNPAQHEIVRFYGTDINLGYYLDEHGERRDRRDLGSLEMLNATKGDLQAWTQWYRTMCDTSIPAELRLKQREGFEQLYLGNVTLTGVATRLIFTPQFIQALDAACTAAGVAVNFENLTTVFGATRFAGNELIGQYTVNGAAQAQYGNTAQQAQYGFSGGGISSGRLY